MGVSPDKEFQRGRRVWGLSTHPFWCGSMWWRSIGESRRRRRRLEWWERGGKGGKGMMCNVGGWVLLLGWGGGTECVDARGGWGGGEGGEWLFARQTVSGCVYDEPKYNNRQLCHYCCGLMPCWFLLFYFLFCFRLRICLSWLVLLLVAHTHPQVNQSRNLKSLLRFPLPLVDPPHMPSRHMGARLPPSLSLLLIL
jgi:hypothetical protein